jgi:AcrR family transcriptional regulator
VTGHEARERPRPSIGRRNHTNKVEEIAEAAGVTRGASYYWFADKDEIGRELQHELYERLTAMSLAAPSPHGDTISNMFHAFHGSGRASAETARPCRHQPTTTYRPTQSPL